MRTLLALFLILAACCAFAQTPEATVQKFAATIAAKDLDGAARMVKNGTLAKVMKDAMLSSKQWPTLTLTNLRSKVTGNTASVTYFLTMGVVTTVPAHDETLNLVKGPGGWLITFSGNEDQGQRSILPGIVYMFTHPDQVAQTGAAARATTCLSSVRRIAVALLMYASDHHGVFDITSANWRSKGLAIYEKALRFTCPSDTSGAASYSFNDNLSKKDTGKIKHPDQVVLAYEGKNGVLNFRHEGRAAVAFLDGHVRRVSKEQAASLKWKG